MLVLYAEDDIEDYSLLLEVLTLIKPGVECVNVVNGVQALQFLDDCEVLPDYIFLDVNMPAMDGKACLKAIRRDERFKTIPIIIYTTTENTLDKEFCLELGVLAYLPKPNSLNEAQAALQEIFSL